MPQYTQGTVTVTNGSATVTGTGTAWLTEIGASDLFTIVGTGTVYQVSAVASDTSLTLTTTFAGTTGSGLDYVIARDFTPNFQIPLLKKGDLETASIYSRGMEIVDELAFEGGVGVTDHGLLTGLNDDDHTQYLTQARGDARYFTETELTNGQLDGRYYTETEVDAALAAKASSTHTHTTTDITNLSSYTGFDSRYYTETELNNGQLDTRYFTEAEVTASLAGKANTSHTHTAANVTDFSAEVDARIGLAGINALSDVAITGPSTNQILKFDGTNWINASVSTGSGVSDHGDLTGLSDDDHTQYHNDARGDIRYYTKTAVDDALALKASSTHTHAAADITSGTLADARLSANVARRDLINNFAETVKLPLGAVGGPALTFTSDDNTGLFGDGADTLTITAGGKEAVVIDGSTTTTNYLTVTPGASSPLELSAVGADTWIGLHLTAKGTSTSSKVILQTDSAGTNYEMLSVYPRNSITGPQNYLTIQSANTLLKPMIQAAGVDGDISIDIRGKGTGSVFLNTTGAYVTSTGVFTGDGSGLTNLNGSNIASGTISAARIAGNIARNDTSNVFSATQIISAAEGQLVLTETDATDPLDQATIEVQNNALRFYAFDNSAASWKMLYSGNLTTGNSFAGGTWDFDNMPTVDGSPLVLAAHTHTLLDLSDVTITSPATNDIIKYNGSEWINAPAGTFGSGTSVTVSDTAPGSPSNGDLWYDSVNAVMMVYYVDGSSNQWVDTAPSGIQGLQGLQGTTGAGTQGVQGLQGPAGSGASSFGDGAVGTPSIYFTNDTDTGIYKSAAGYIDFTTNGMQNLRIEGTGSADSYWVIDNYNGTNSYSSGPDIYVESSNANAAGYLTTKGIGTLFLQGGQSVDINARYSGSNFLVGSFNQTGSAPEIYNWNYSGSSYRNVTTYGNWTFSGSTVTATSFVGPCTQVALTATNTTNATHYITFVDAATGNENIRTDTGLTYNPSTGVLTSTSFAGAATQVALTATNSTAATHYITFVDAATGNEDIRTDTDLTWNPSTNVLSIGGIEVGYKNIPQNIQAASYTCVLADASKHIFHANGAGASDTYTIPANSSVAYPIGTEITFINMDGNAVSIAITTDAMYLAGTGTTGTRTLAQYGVARAIKIDTTAWLISGTGLT
jgi:Phage tail repeat like